MSFFVLGTATSTMLKIFIKMLRISQLVAQKLSPNSQDLVVQGASIVAETGRNSNSVLKN